MKKIKKTLSYLLAAAMIFGLLPAFSMNVKAASIPVLTFSDSGITETVPGTGYSIKDNALTFSAAGTYKVTGTCSEGSIDVKKSVSGVTIILSNLNLTSSTTAPIVIKKESSATIHIDGTNTLKNTENPANENSTDPDVADAYEGAAIKVKSTSSLVFCGDGTLNIYGSSKNGIKGGTD